MKAAFFLILFHQIEGDIGYHVFLPANHFALADFDEDSAGVDAIHLGRLFRMPQERRIHARIVEAQGLAVNP
jgi:hypothetical protein